MFDSIRITARDVAIILLVIENAVVSAAILFLLVKSAGLLKSAKPKAVSIIRQAVAIAIQANHVVTNVSIRVVTPIAQYHGFKIGLRDGVRRIFQRRRKEAPGV